MNLNDLKTNFNKKFVFSKEVAEILHLGYTSEENVILYGRGGHGKSFFAEEFFIHMDKKPFVKVLGKGTMIEDLLGGLDIKKFQDEGKLEYFVENSFMNHEYVILEEALDAPLHVLEQLKDILTSKRFRNGDQVFEIKTRFIVICTNRTRHELADDDSIKALMERFPLELKVEWPEYKAAGYADMFSKVIGRRMEEFAIIIEKVNEYSFISPRTAVKAAKIYAMYGNDLTMLKYVAGFSDGVIDSMKENLARVQVEAKIAAKLNTILNKMHSAIKEDQDNITKYSPIKCLQRAMVWQQLIVHMRNFAVTDNLYKAHTDAMTTMTRQVIALEEAAKKNTTFDINAVELAKLKEIQVAVVG